MKNIYTFHLILSIGLLFTAEKAHSQGQTHLDSVLLGPNYQNQIYYNFKDKEVLNIKNTDWDVAFQLTKFSVGADLYHPKGAAILINGALGTELYTIQNSTDFNTADTTNFSKPSASASWKKMYNSDSSFNDGAFNQNRTKNPFDFGWGNYGFFTNNHNVTGDSIFLVKTRNGKFKKFFIDSLKSGIWHFRYANVDNSELSIKSINKYTFDTTKLFAYVNLETDEILNPEAINAKWDLLFSKYTSKKNGKVNPCISIMTNELMGTTAGVDSISSFANAKEPNTYSTNMNIIGDHWNDCDVTDTAKSCNIPVSKVYFVKTQNNGYYKVQVIKTDKSIGKIVFIYEYVKGTLIGLDNKEANSNFDVFPNPSRGKLIIQQTNTASTPNKIQFYNASASLVKELDLGSEVLRNGYEVDINNLSNGLYYLRLINKNGNYCRKFVLQK